MTLSPTFGAGAWLVALSCLLLAVNSGGAEPEAQEAYAYVRRINGAAGRIVATPLQGAFREGMPVTVHDKTGTVICAGTARSVYEDVV